METKEAIRIVLEYAKHDKTVGGFAEAVEKLDDEFGKKTLSFEAETFEPKSKNFKPIPPFSFVVARWGVKEDVLRPNPHAKSS